MSVMNGVHATCKLPSRHKQQATLDIKAFHYRNVEAAARLTSSKEGDVLACTKSIPGMLIRQY